MTEGRQINLDKGEGTILDGYIVDDIYAPSSFLNIIFESPKKLVFGADENYYFTFSNIDWIPLSFDETKGIQMAWHYEINAVPRCLVKLIKKPTKNCQELARAMNLNLTDLSSNLELPCSIINQYAGNIIQNLRLYSLEEAYVKQKIGEAIYIYAGTSQMYSNTWKSLVSQTALPLMFPASTEGSNLPTYQDYQFDSLFSTSNGPNIWNQSDFIGKLIGTQFKIKTTIPAIFLNVYTIKFSKIPEFDTGIPFLCTYSKRKICETNAFENYFSNIKYIV